jgi:hypothetical protein
MIKKNESWTISCKCGKSITVIKSLKEAEDQKWEINRTCHSNYIENEVKGLQGVFCPECAEKKRLVLYESLNIRDRLRAGFYNDFPEKWNDDVIKHLGIEGHPKASALIGIAYDKGHSGGKEEMLSEAESIVELLK